MVQNNPWEEPVKKEQVWEPEVRSFYRQDPWSPQWEMRETP